MEEVLNSITHAIELAKKIEPELANTRPDLLSTSIDGVIRAFLAARERLMVMAMTTTTTTDTPLPQEQGREEEITRGLSSPFVVPMLLPHDEAVQQQLGRVDSGSPMQEWLRPYTQTMDQLLHLQQQQQLGPLMNEAIRHVEGEDHQGVIEPSLSSRPRKRKNDAEKITRLFPAPLVGNTEMPPEDGFTWRKYGQKEILGSKHPRSYYRCTHQKLYACPAKKQVQRLDHSPDIFEVTYLGEHTCHMSSTAPSSFPPPPLPPQLLVDITQSTTTLAQVASPSPASVSRWLQQPSVGLGLQGRSGGEDGAGPSTSKYTADYPVAELADAMFNSGSSSGNSMENLFPSGEDKWEPIEKES